jgi:predicted nucleic acid-binding protein
MIADTTFLSHFLAEGRTRSAGPARTFFVHHRAELIRTSIICIGEVAVTFPRSADAWEYFKLWKILSLHSGIAAAAADVDRELVRTGHRLGENDNWIAGFCRYYREPIVSRDQAFDRVPGLRRVAY